MPAVVMYRSSPRLSTHFKCTRHTILYIGMLHTVCIGLTSFRGYWCIGVLGSHGLVQKIVWIRQDHMDLF